jgi:adenylate cyclase
MTHFLAERYEEAIVWAKKSLQLREHQPGAYRLLAASYGHLGQVEDARAALDRMYELTPGFSLEVLRLRIAPVIVERYLEGWRKAGWKE